MNNDSLNTGELSELIMAVIDGDDTENQFSKLNDLFEKDASARRYYLEYLFVYVGISENISCLYEDQNKPTILFKDDTAVFRDTVRKDLYDSAIRRAIEEAETRQCSLEESLPVNKPQTRPRFGRREVFQSMLRIAAIVIVALGIIWLDRQMRRPPAMPVAVATIAESINAKWGKMEVPYEEGSWLYTGAEPIYLQEGLVKVKFDHGTEVILEAPCEFNFLSSRRMRLNLGRLCAKVTQKGHGFTVTAPGCSIVDLGTEFGVIVTNEGFSETHVLDGQVELWEEKPAGRSQTPYRLHKGQVGSFNRQGNVCIEKRAAQPLAFVRSLDPGAIEADYVRTLTRTPGLVSYWNLNETSGITVADLIPGDAVDGDNPGTYYGAGVTLGVAGPRPTDGFGGFSADNCAPEFSDDVNTRLQMAVHNVYAEQKDISLIVWVKYPDIPASFDDRRAIGGLQRNMVDNRYVFATALYNPPVGLQAFVKRSDDSKQEFSTRYPGDVNIWHMWIITLESGRIFQCYLDGKLMETCSFETDSLGLYPPDGLIFGNDIRVSENRPWKGGLDEIAVFNRAISETEIQSLWDVALGKSLK
ncbi:MAG: FecR domain-containing protein [Sedimentisphaerales bacterium]|nr:FecR domain-containing protein [Sedimentisphaerales bacterium]